MGGMCAPSKAKESLVSVPAGKADSNQKSLPSGGGEQLETPNAASMVNEIKTIEKKDAPMIQEGELKAEEVVEI